MTLTKAIRLYRATSYVREGNYYDLFNGTVIVGSIRADIITEGENGTG